MESQTEHGGLLKIALQIYKKLIDISPFFGNLQKSNLGIELLLQ